MKYLIYPNKYIITNINIYEIFNIYTQTKYIIININIYEIFNIYTQTKIL